MSDERVKIFNIKTTIDCKNKEQLLEDKINEWLFDNNDVEIVERLSNLSSVVTYHGKDYLNFTVIIFYKC